MGLSSNKLHLPIDARIELDSKVELELWIEAKAELDLSSMNLDLINSVTGFLPSAKQVP